MLLFDYVIPFLLILTVLVFVHEMGHYWVARRNGVRVEVFSIGFGPELFGWTDRVQTRWKISLLPLGGYVKMYGEHAFDESAPGEAEAGAAAMTEADRAVSFAHKRLGQRAAIVAAGPLANFVFAIVVFAFMFSIVGQPYTPADVGDVLPDSPAAAAGLQPGDVIREIDGSSIERFEDVQQIVQLHPETEMQFVVERDGALVRMMVRPRLAEIQDNFGNVHRVGQIGITRAAAERVRRDPLTAVWQATRETFRLTGATLTAVGQMIQGTRTAEELGGPLRIAKMSGEVAQIDMVSVFWFLAYLSINLGLINLFPIPMLDGGHLLFYAFEAARGKPLGPRVQEYGFRIGIALVLTLMLFATWNDLVHFRVVEFIKGLIT